MSPRANVVLGEKYNRLTVVEDLGVIRAATWVRCRCDCGTIKDYRYCRIKRGDYQSCGCLVIELGQTKRSDVVVGTVFGRWTVTKYLGVVCGNTQVQVTCVCGVVKELPYGYLTREVSTSCGCYQRERASESLTKHRLVSGERYGRWTVVKLSATKGKNRKYICRCDCGTEREVYAEYLVNGGSVSCGCYKNELAAVRSTTHGMSDLPEYHIWQGIKARCNNTRGVGYADYGGRGIVICDAWSASFEQFYQDAGPRPSSEHSLDRIDFNGNYEPGNVRWATLDQQANNKRSNVRLTINGTTQTVSEWCKEMKIKPARVRYALRRGLTPYEAVFLGYPRTRKRRELLNWKGCNNKKDAAA